MNVVGDVAGQFDALMQLVDQMPHEDFIFVGDLIDRGPKSKEVVEWVKSNAKATLGNHELMLIDFYDTLFVPLKQTERLELFNAYIDAYYSGFELNKAGKITRIPSGEKGSLIKMIMYLESKGIEFNEPIYSHYIINGGINTLLSYKDSFSLLQTHINWMRTLPKYIKIPGVFISHAPWGHSRDINKPTKDASDYNIVWDRAEPPPRVDAQGKPVLQLYGHNSEHKKLGDYAICIDNSGAYRNPSISGYNTETKQMYHAGFSRQASLGSKIISSREL